MTGMVTDLRHEGPEVRLLTADEIDLVTGGKGVGGCDFGHHNKVGTPSIGGGLAAVIANVLATGDSTFTEAVTRAITIGDVSIAIGFGIAIGVGAGSSAGISITTTATS